MNYFWGVCHDLAGSEGKRIRLIFKRPSEITVGNNTKKPVVAIQNSCKTELLRGDLEKGLPHDRSKSHPGDLVTHMHDLGYSQQAPAQGSYRVKESKVVLSESTCLQQSHGQCVAQSHSHSCTGCGGKIQRTRLLCHRNIQNNIRPGSQGGGGSPGHADNRNAQPFYTRKEPDEFLGLPAVGNGDQNIPSCQHAQITVSPFSGVQEQGRRPGAGKGGCYFPADKT